MTDHSWHAVGMMTKPEFVGSIPIRGVIQTPHESPDPPGRTVIEDLEYMYLCKRCGCYANGQDGKTRSDPCDVALVRKLMGE
jgi:hypothetical protein